MDIAHGNLSNEELLRLARFLPEFTPLERTLFDRLTTTLDEVDALTTDIAEARQMQIRMKDEPVEPERRRNGDNP